MTDDPSSASDGEDGGVMSPGQAAGRPDGTDVTVAGFLVEDGGIVVLAEALAESYPPQAGGNSVAVDGLDLSGVELKQLGPVRWSNTTVTLSGTINGGRLTGATVRE